MSEIYERGNDSISPDTVKSIKFLKKAAEGGLPEAQNYLGFLFMTGRMMIQNSDSALFWLKKSASQGYSTAAANIGYLYAEGLGVEPDMNKAFEWLKLAASQNNPVAETQLADLILKNAKFPSDTVESVNLYKKAASHGYSAADVKLSHMISKSQCKVEPDSIIPLSISYYTGHLPYSGIKLLEQYLSRAYEKNGYDRSVAYAVLAHALSHGRGISYNHSLADAMFLKAALLGNPSAEFILSESLEFFPDMFNSRESEKVLSEFYKDGKIPENIYDPSYWRKRAANEGISDSRTAIEKLFNQDAYAEKHP